MWIEGCDSWNGILIEARRTASCWGKKASLRYHQSPTNSNILTSCASGPRAVPRLQNNGYCQFQSTPPPLFLLPKCAFSSSLTPHLHIPFTSTSPSSSSPHFHIPFHLSPPPPYTPEEYYPASLPTPSSSWARAAVAVASHATLPTKWGLEERSAGEEELLAPLPGEGRGARGEVVAVEAVEVAVKKERLMIQGPGGRGKWGG